MLCQLLLQKPLIYVYSDIPVGSYFKLVEYTSTFCSAEQKDQSRKSIVLLLWSLPHFLIIYTHLTCGSIPLQVRPLSLPISLSNNRCSVQVTAKGFSEAHMRSCLLVLRGMLSSFLAPRLVSQMGAPARVACTKDGRGNIKHSRKERRQCRESSWGDKDPLLTKVGDRLQRNR